jgi:hypothetical protein
MECRKPLYTIVNPHVANNSAQSNVLRRYQSNNVHQPKPQVPIKKRLPLPKNLVLMSLIEATELAAESVRAHQGQEPSLTESPKVSGPASSAVWDDDDDEQGEEEKIKASTSLAISDCGTYAVANGEGLEIFPSRPGSGNPKTKDEEQEEDVDTLVRFFHLEHKGDVSDKSVEQISQAQLCMGDRIQIVSIENGWAKLARGYGYVKADGRKLVKGKHIVCVCVLTFHARPIKLESLNYSIYPIQSEDLSIELASWRPCCGFYLLVERNYERNK